MFVGVVRWRFCVVDFGGSNGGPGCGAGRRASGGAVRRASRVRWRGARCAVRGLTVLVLAVAACAYALALWRAPDWAHAHGAGDRHDVRVLVVSVAGAVVVAISLLYTARTYRLSHRGQVTDRFTKARERLSSPDIDARLGGIHTLAHVAHDSRPHHDDAVEVLETFIRRRAPAARPARRWPHDPPLPTGPTPTCRPPSPPGRRPIRPERRTLCLCVLHLAGARLSGLDYNGTGFANEPDSRGAGLREPDSHGPDPREPDEHESAPRTLARREPAHRVPDRRGPDRYGTSGGAYTRIAGQPVAR